MEIEAKFAIPNRQVYRELNRLDRLARYAATPTGTVRLVDHYFDTADDRLFAAGYACRLRTQGKNVIATLKGLARATGAVHRREEHEVHLPAWTPNVAEWPESPARSLVMELADGAELVPLFELTQRRTTADLLDGDRLVGELCTDAVRVAVGKRPALYYELEIELAETGTEADLAALEEVLTRDWGLTPEGRSKFERALEALRRRGSALEDRLSPAERAALEDLASGEDVEVARRARVVLAWADGLPTREIVDRAGLSGGRVRYWLRAFRSERMGIFPEGSVVAAPSQDAESQPAVQAARPGKPQAVKPSTETKPKDATEKPGGKKPAAKRKPKQGALLSVTDFCRQNGVDMAHARWVAKQALALFDILKPVHKLPRKRRRVLKWAALLNSIGTVADAEHPHRAGRDLILAQPLKKVTTAERLALACIVAFNRRKVRAKREPTMEAVTGRLRSDILPLTALLRMAEALDASSTQGTQILGLADGGNDRRELLVRGPAADVDAARATQRADLWFKLYQQELSFLPQPVATGAEVGTAAPATKPPAAPKAPEKPVEPEIPPIQPEEAMSEAGRKVVYRHFIRMLANEAGTRLGEDIEALHDMRVATRRMRAAFEVFGAHYDDEALTPFKKGLRRTGRVLGAVRDLDVLLDKAQAYQAGLPPEDGESLEPLLEHWRRQRSIARRQMSDYLDSRSYRRFVTEFEAFLTTPGAGAKSIPPGEPVPYQVRHVVPRLIMRRYEAVRAYEPILPGAPVTTLHRLRVDCKRLRYAMEFFRDVLGPEAPALIEQVVGIQDLLGALQDAHVAEGLVDDFLSASRKKGGAGKPLPGVIAYRDMLQTLQRDRVAAFPEPWAALIGYDFRHALGLCLARL